MYISISNCKFIHCPQSFYLHSMLDDADEHKKERCNVFAVVAAASSAAFTDTLPLNICPDSPNDQNQ